MTTGTVRAWRRLRPRERRQAEDAHRVASLVPGLAIVVTVAASDLLTGDRIALITLMAVAPLATAITGSVREAAVVTVAAVAAGVAGGWWNGSLGTVQHLVRLNVIAIVGLAAVYSVVLRSRRDVALARMTAVAEVAQLAVLRPLPRQVGGVRFAACYHSAARAARVGGDLYEAVDTDHGVRVIIGDVRGKGLDAVRLAAGVLGAFRLSVHSRPSLADVARDLDGYVTRDSNDEEFVTALLVEFGDAVTLVNCGHHPPAVLHGDRVLLRPIPETAPPLGLGSTPRAVALPLAAGDRMVLYTDGIVEARDAAGRFLRIDEALRGLAGCGVDVVAETLVARLRRHVNGPLNDDFAVVVAQPGAGDRTPPRAATADDARAG